MTATSHSVTPEFDKEAFFDDIVARLHAQGTMKSYPTPLGRDCGPEMRFGASTSSKGSTEPTGFSHRERRTLGLSRFIGDVPYHGVAIDHITNSKVSAFRGIEQKDIALKLRSMHKAIECYIPTDAFSEWLDYIKLNPGDEGFRDAYKHSLSVMQKDTQGTYETGCIRPAIRRGYRRNDVRVEVFGDSIMTHMHKYPDLVTAFAMYHASHRAYLDELAEAISRSPDLSDDERANGLTFLSSEDMRVFDSFLLFPTLLPLTIHYYEEALARCPVKPASNGHTKADSVSHEHMKAAIDKAWETFFEREMLMDSFGADHKITSDHKNAALQVTCPAISHLRKTAKDQTLQDIYDSVVANPNMACRQSAVIAMASTIMAVSGR